MYGEESKISTKELLKVLQFTLKMTLFQLITFGLENEEEKQEEHAWEIFNDERDVMNGYDRASMMGMLYCIAKALGETNPAFVPILVYLDRMCINHPKFIISENNIRRLCVVAIWVSDKMFDDFYIANCCYAELLGIPNQHFNYLERVFVQMLQYDLNVTQEEYKAYWSHMRNFILDTFCRTSTPQDSRPDEDSNQIENQQDQP